MASAEAQQAEGLPAKHQESKTRPILLEQQSNARIEDIMKNKVLEPRGEDSGYPFTVTEQLEKGSHA